MIQIEIKNKIRIRGLPDNVLAHIKKTLTLTNPKYHQLYRKNGFRPRGISPWFTYYKQKGNWLEVPRGMRLRILNFLNTMKLDYKLTEDYICQKRK